MKDLIKNTGLLAFTGASCSDFVGERCSSIVLPILIYAATGNIYSTAFLILLRFLPKFISNYFVKKLNDWALPPIFVLKSTAAIRMAAVLWLLLATEPFHYYLFTAIFYFSGSLCYAYRYSLLRTLCPEAELPQANNLLALLENIMMLAAPILGGWLYAMFGLRPVAVLSAACFLTSLLALNGIKTELPCPSGANAAPATLQAPRSFLAELGRIARTYPIPFLLITVDTVASISFGSLNTVLPILVQEQYQNNASYYSYLNAALSFGLIAGNVVFHRWLSKAGFLSVYIISTFLATLFFMLLGLGSHIAVLILLLFAIGACNSVQDSSLVTEIQLSMHTSSDISFIFSIYQSFLALTIVLSTVLVPFVISHQGASFLFITFGIVNIAGLTLLLLSKHRTE